MIRNGAFLLLTLLDFFLIFSAAASHRSIHGHRNDDVLARIARIEKMVAPTLAPDESSLQHIYHVTNYGADPTGNADSTASIMRAITDAFRNPNGRKLVEEVNNLGGVEINLDGGSYLISSPIVLPPKNGNIKIYGGTLRAASNFPANRHILELSAHAKVSVTDTGFINDTKNAAPKYDYEYVTIRDVLFDGNYAAGGISVINALRTTIDNCYITYFSSEGILVKAGHETVIRGCYIGQHPTGGQDPTEKHFSGTGIHLMGNDNIVTDTVIFSAATGILVSGQANIFTGVHCYNKATGWGGTGIYLKLPGNTATRIINCYMDWNSIVAEDPVQLVITGTFFLGDGNIVLKSVRGIIKDVHIVGNSFSGRGKGVENVHLDGVFNDVAAVVVQHNGVNGMTVRSTVAKASASGNGKSWTVDFSGVLLFRNVIGSVLYSFSPASGFPVHAIRSVEGNRVVVESNVPVQATVYVTVDQTYGMT